MSDQNNKPKILIVDDRDANLLALEKILAKIDIQIFKANSGNEALALTIKHDFAVILLDVQMPDMDGYEVAEFLRNEENTKHVPVIFITAIDRDESYEMKGYESGAIDFIFKPINENILLSKVNVLIQLYRQREELVDINKQLQLSSEKAESLAKDALMASEAKGQFLANMSHEIRTPMNAIIGFSDLLTEEDLTEDQSGYVNLVRDSANNLLDLINDILDFSKIEAKQLEMETVECSLGRILCFIDSTMKLLTEKKSIEFEIIESSDLPECICTDPARLRQCLVNLANNAIKFTKEGHVHVNVSLENIDDQPYIRFDVEDTGIGIPEDKQQAIFGAFIQADGSHTRKFGGTGLGLAVTKELAGLLGGELTVSSEVGTGSIFSLVIPAGLDVTQQPKLDITAIHTNQRSAQDEDAKFSGHVLVAEDSPTSQELINLLLKQTGLKVTLVSDGNEALQKVLVQQFDLILMDMMMPNMDGYEATGEIRKEGIDTPIVALTANAMKGDDKKCLEAGCDGYLTKPINRVELLKTIGEFLSPALTGASDNQG